MGKKIKLMLFAIALISISCSKVDNDLSSDLLKGVWVNSITQTDTLDFNIKPQFTNSANTFLLKRGTEMRKGQEMPKIGSGYYEYIISGDKIFLKGLVLDIHSNKDYLFKLSQDSKSLQIGAFVPFESGNTVNEFVRIN